MREVLPLEPHAALGEHAHLACDQVVELGTVEAAELAVVEEAATRPVRVSQERPVLFERDSIRQPVRDDAAELRIEGHEQLGRLGVGHDRGPYEPAKHCGTGTGTKSPRRQDAELRRC